jgi:hypothetical protein
VKHDALDYGRRVPAVVDARNGQEVGTVIVPSLELKVWGGTALNRHRNLDGIAGVGGRAHLNPAEQGKLVDAYAGE